MEHDMILIADFGSQYTQLIARRIRECNVYCEIHPYNHLPSLGPHIKGLILSGSPASVNDAEAPQPSLDPLSLSIPVLGVCYGAQWLAKSSGGTVQPSKTREYGRAQLLPNGNKSPLLKGISNGSQVWMSHSDTVINLPEPYELIAGTDGVEVAAFQHRQRPVFAIQFHPEVTHSLEGRLILANFLFDICGCSPDWTPVSFVEQSVEEIRQKVGQDKVVLGLSGGVDSSVAAMLLHRAIGKQLYCIFVDNGLLRKNEFSQVLDSYQHMGLQVKGVDASRDFYQALKGLTDPEQKRKAIGRVFIDVFDREAHRIDQVKWLGQGTIYPDVIESVSVKGPSATIKSHHNVGGLPELMKLKVIEPLRSLFKDEVRSVGQSLGLDPAILGRHPFPGPGLAIRILGDITPEKVHLLQEVDDIYIGMLKSSGWYQQVWQAGAILLPVQSVGVMGDERTYERVVALRAVSSTDGMTADWVHLPYELLAEISNKIINQVKGVNRVVYDISSKPPATIEWE